MSTITLKILDEREEESVMTLLNALVANQIIEVATKDPFLMPGNRIPVDQLNARIEEAERSPRLSVEEVKARLGL